MMNWIWAGVAIIGIVWGLITGQQAALSQGVMQGAMDAVGLCVKLAGGFALWSGLLAILERGGAMESMARITEPLMRRLFPGTGLKARQSIAMNMTANLLGLGNAATPQGLEAMRRMGAEASAAEPNETATDAMCMFLVINASSIQLFPTTVIAMRAAAGSASPASIVAATLAASGISTLAGVAACVLLRNLFWRRRA
ncbi:MAG: hypothetical protein LBH66_05300 [Oscillospiraceae bacterium]|jgi:spore maturation protein A|nr:hypothetical protein [Oscillospiraceae bacterium]